MKERLESNYHNGQGPIITMDRGVVSSFGTVGKRNRLGEGGICPVEWGERRNSAPALHTLAADATAVGLQLLQAGGQAHCT